MRGGRCGENRRPVENENSVRQPGGKQLISPAISCPAGGPPWIPMLTQSNDA